jgi:phospholipid-binding lipoprotein MlaA
MPREFPLRRSDLYRQVTRRPVALPDSLFRALIFSLCLLLCGGCATTKPAAEKNAIPGIEADKPGPYEQLDVNEPTVIAYEDYQDPLESFNRAMFKFNDVSYRYLLTPLAKGYRKITPKPVNKSIGNFFLNLREPLFAVNKLLQAEPVDSGKSLLRLGINSTVGLLGLFDPATAWFKLPREKTSFGDTLAFYGVGYGAYLVLPLAGPSDFRSGTSIVFDYFLHPLNYLEDESTATALKLFDRFQDNAEMLDTYPTLTAESEDAYIFLRNLYLQRLQRDADDLRGEFDPATGDE